MAVFMTQRYFLLMILVAIGMIVIDMEVGS